MEENVYSFKALLLKQHRHSQYCPLLITYNVQKQRGKRSGIMQMTYIYRWRWRRVFIWFCECSSLKTFPHLLPR